MQNEQIELDIFVDADCLWFAGHFPEQPILPGVVHIGWAAAFAERHWSMSSPPPTLERVKFKRPIVPDTRLTLHLQSLGHKIKYDYRQDAVSVSSGTLCFKGE